MRGNELKSKECRNQCTSALRYCKWKGKWNNIRVIGAIHRKTRVKYLSMIISEVQRWRLEEDFWNGKRVRMLFCAYTRSGEIVLQRSTLLSLEKKGEPSLQRLRGRAATKAVLASLEMRLTGSSPRLTVTAPNHGQFVPAPIGLRQPGILFTKENGLRSRIESLKPDVPTMTYTTLEKQSQHIMCLQDWRSYIYLLCSRIL